MTAGTVTVTQAASRRPPAAQPQPAAATSRCRARQAAPQQPPRPAQAHHRVTVCGTVNFSETVTTWPAGGPGRVQLQVDMYSLSKGISAAGTRSLRVRIRLPGRVTESRVTDRVRPPGPQAASDSASESQLDLAIVTVPLRLHAGGARHPGDDGRCRNDWKVEGWIAVS